MCCTSLYHIFCCNMFVFACPKIASNHCRLSALKRNIRIYLHIFFKPDSKQKYLQVEQKQLSCGFIFLICQFKDLFCNIKLFLDMQKRTYCNKICDKVMYNTYCIVSFVLFVFILCFVYPMLPISMDFPFWIAPSVFSDVY
jgi:hypothetical protein